MELKVYDRKLKTMVVQNQFEKKYLDFLYKTVIGRMMLKLFFTRKAFSKLYAFYTDSKGSVKKIPSFIQKNNINMDEYKQKDYTCFNEFFSREIKPEKRPFSLDADMLISPADSKLTVYRVDDDLKLNIKKSSYTIGQLLRDEDLAKDYKNGVCLVFRLTVDDYHRYHFIDDGNVVSQKTINGILHTVNPISSERYNVYVENHREISVLNSENLGEYIQIEVGAVLVGKINNNKVSSFKRGDEKGYFSFGGSTVILLFKEGTIKVDEDILEYSEKDIETKVRMGETIGRIIRCSKD